MFSFAIHSYSTSRTLQASRTLLAVAVDRTQKGKFFSAVLLKIKSAKMSESANGNGVGDIPEIELIIKVRYSSSHNTNSLSLS